MSGGHGIHIVGFAIGGFLPMEFPSVPGRGTLLPEWLFVADRRVSFAEYDIRPEVGGGMFFQARHGIRYGFDVGGSVEPRSIVFVVAAAAAFWDSRAGTADRKSTRLNFSH